MFCFISVGVRAVAKFLVSIKNLQQCKKLPWCVKKKEAFHETFHSMQNFLELQCLVDDLLNFLESSMFNNASLS